MTTRRVSRFVVIGAIGFVVQMTVAALLLAAGLMPVAATVLAIEAAIVSNHAWQRRWAWRDRAHHQSWPATLVRAHLGAGGTSLVVGAGTVAALSGHVPPLGAQAMAVGLCAVANYWIADRWVFAASAAGLLVLFAPGEASAAGPSPDALQSWTRYVSALERARALDLTRGVPAWATDDDPSGARVRSALARGEIDVTRRTLPGVVVEGATLEHWQGSLRLRGVTLAQVAERLRHPDRFPQPPDVVALAVSGRSDDGHDLYLRLTRSMLVTAIYDTWHRVRHAWRGPNRIDSTSLATRIVEIEGHDFLWRMQSSWRFAAVPEGVIVTCESISLSRPVPVGLGLVSRPIIARVARESMTTAIKAWQAGWPGAGRASAP